MQNEKRFFASLNTERGFVSYYDEIYGKLDRVYIVKGAPGTGKSHFMREIADEAEKLKYSVEYFYCSSDPLSLDGIIIDELKTAVIDGTAPHLYDPKYAGVKDKIINLGEHWNESILLKYAEEIIMLSDKKKYLYANLYNYLSAAGRIDTELRNINSRCVKYEKMYAAVERITRSWKNGEGFDKQIRIIEGISAAGTIKYNTYFSMAKNKYAIKDRYGIGTIMTEMLLKIACEKRMKVIYSPYYLNPSYVSAVYFPEISCAFVICDSPEDDVKQINMDRFIDIERIRADKQKFRFAGRCLAGIFEGAESVFSEINETHSALEKYYIKAMDFSKNDIAVERVKKEIFKN